MDDLLNDQIFSSDQEKIILPRLYNSGNFTGLDLVYTENPNPPVYLSQQKTGLNQ
jgi:hypothetical protein